MANTNPVSVPQALTQIVNSINGRRLSKKQVHDFVELVIDHTPYAFGRHLNISWGIWFFCEHCKECYFDEEEDYLSCLSDNIPHEIEVVYFDVFFFECHEPCMQRYYDATMCELKCIPKWCPRLDYFQQRRCP